MVTNDLKPDDLLHPARPLHFPRSVVEMMQGSSASPTEGWPSDFRDVVLQSAHAKPIAGRPGASMPPADFEKAAQELEAAGLAEPREEHVLSYLLYPDVFREYLAHRQQHVRHVNVMPTPNFFYGLQPGQEISIEIERGKTLIVRYLTTGEVREDGTGPSSSS